MPSTTARYFSFNAGADIADGIQFYSFGSYGDKKAESYENYRTPSTVSYQGPLSGGVKVYLLPLGFSPLEATRETDYDLTAGLKGELDAWKWDLSASYGYNKVRRVHVEFRERGYRWWVYRHHGCRDSWH